jgi:hypothetical protein
MCWLFFLISTRADFFENIQYKILRKYSQWGPSSSMRSERQPEGQTDKHTR